MTDSNDKPTLNVQVIYALANKQRLIDLKVVVGCTVIEAVEQSRIAEQFPEIDLATVKLGVFAKVVKKDLVLEGGERIEIYRPLIANPKEARKKRAEKSDKE